MKSPIYLIRILETFFLVGFVVTYTVTPEGVSWSYTFISVLCNFSFSTNAEEIVISSIFVGYPISLLGTTLYWKHLKPRPRRWSVGLAVLGVFASGNEVLRYLLGYDFQVLIQFPTVLVIIDWAMFKGFRWFPTGQSQRVE